jgi:hypothetical protein
MFRRGLLAVRLILGCSIRNLSVKIVKEFLNALAPVLYDDSCHGRYMRSAKG